MRFVIMALGVAFAAACASSEGADENARPTEVPDAPPPKREEPGPAGACTNPELLPELPRLGLRRCMGLPSSPTSDPSKAGKYPVGVKTLTLADPARPGRSLTTEVWYPADESARGKSGAKYGAKVSDIAKQMGQEIPIDMGTIDVVSTDAVRDAPRAPIDQTTGLVVFSHGFRGARFQSTFLTVYLATHGYVVAAPEHTGNTMFDGSATPEQSASDRLFDMAFVTSELIARAKTQGDFFHQAFDPRRVAWTGHSFGASTTIMGGALDNREIVAIPLAPAFDERMAHVQAVPSYDLRSAAFVIGGTADDTTPPEHQKLAYDRTVAPRYLAMLDGVTHFDFTDVCTNSTLRLIPQLASSCGPNTNEAQKTIRTLATAALHRFMRCDPAADAWLDPKWVGSRPKMKSFVADPGPAVATAAEPSKSLCDVAVEGTVNVETRTIVRANAPSIEARIASASLSARPIVFVHGFGTTRAAFDRQLAKLGGRFRAIAIDLRGHGGSAADPTAPFGSDKAPSTDDDPYAIDRYVDDVRAVLDELDLKDVVLVGWSSGGQVAMKTVLSGSTRVTKLVLVDTAPLLRTDPRLHATFNGGGTLEFASDLGSAFAKPAHWSRISDGYVAEGAPAELRQSFFTMIDTTKDATRRGHMFAKPTDLVDDASKIAIPTLVVHGEQDDVILLENAHFFAKAIAKAELVVFQRSGHAPFAEEPERFNRLLDRFASDTK